jgi:hypothetical protein
MANFASTNAPDPKSRFDAFVAFDGSPVNYVYKSMGQGIGKQGLVHDNVIIFTIIGRAASLAVYGYFSRQSKNYCLSMGSCLKNLGL